MEWFRKADIAAIEGYKCDECRAAGYDYPAEFGYIIPPRPAI